MNSENSTDTAGQPGGTIRLSAARRFAGRLRDVLLGLWRLLVGVLLCQSWLGAVAVLGWTCRAMQRSALRHWWETAGGPESGLSFRRFVAGSHRTRPLARWPNWIVRQEAAAWIASHGTGSRWTRTRAVAGSAVHSLVANMKTGLGTLFNTWVLTLPACVLWLFAWYDGWNNSFNKGYEQALVGPLTGILGVALFIAAMFYVPLAQARQAVTGDWRCFYDFRVVWAVVRERWAAGVGLALLYAGLAVPINVLKTVPGFLPQIRPDLGALSPDAARDFLKIYFFWSGFVFFPVFVLLRMLAARLYASGLLAAVRRGRLSEEDLGEFEWEALHRLDLLQTRPAARAPVLVRLIAWLGSRAGRLTAGLLLVLVWFSFVAQIYVAEFLTYHPKIGWLNQPLVQLPWFRYVPGRQSSP